MRLPTRDALPYLGALILLFVAVPLVVLKGAPLWFTIPFLFLACWGTLNAEKGLMK